MATLTASFTSPSIGPDGPADGRPPPARPVPRCRRLAQPRYPVLLLAVAAIVVAYLALVPVGTMIYASLQRNFLGIGRARGRFSNYVRHVHRGGLRRAGGELVHLRGRDRDGVAWSSDSAWPGWWRGPTRPAKGFARVAALVPLIMPGILNTVAWALLLSPQTGPLNACCASAQLPAFNIFSLPGMIFVQSMHVMPVAYLMGTAAFTSMDSSLEEAALGLRRLAVADVPQRSRCGWSRPAILSAALLMFDPDDLDVRGAAADRRARTDTFVFVSRIYSALQTFPADYGTVGVIGVFVLVIAAVGLVLSRRLGRGIDRADHDRQGLPAAGARTSAGGAGPGFAVLRACSSSSPWRCRSGDADVVVAAARLRAAVAGTRCARLTLSNYRRSSDTPGPAELGAATA